MRQRPGRTAMLLVSILLVPLHCDAQTKRFYAGIGVIGDNDKTDSRLTNDVALTATLVLGADITRHLGLRLVFEAPRQKRVSSQGVFVRPASPLPIRETATRSQSTETWGVLVDNHGNIGAWLRVALTYGVATVTHDTEIVVLREELRPDGTASPLPDDRLSVDADWTGFAFGSEIPSRSAASRSCRKSA